MKQETPANLHQLLEGLSKNALPLYIYCVKVRGLGYLSPTLWAAPGIKLVLRFGNKCFTY